MTSNHPLCVLGDFAWDVLIRTNTRLQPGGDTLGAVVLSPGGSAANVAVWAARCGQATHFVGKVGTDRFGQLARENLDIEGVSHHLITTDTRLTGSVAVFVDHTGERSMVSGQGADFDLTPDELPISQLHASRHLHLTGWSFFTDPPLGAARHAARVAKQGGATVSFDPGSFQMIDELGVQHFLDITTDLGIDIIFPNREEGAVLTGCDEPVEIAAALADIYTDALVMLKLDDDGAIAYQHGEATIIPAVPAKLIDATGAGDSFAGSFLAGYLQHGDIEEAARLATVVSAWVIEQTGTRPPTDHRLRAALADTLRG